MRQKKEYNALSIHLNLRSILLRRRMIHFFALSTSPDLGPCDLNLKKNNLLIQPSVCGSDSELKGSILANHDAF